MNALGKKYLNTTVITIIKYNCDKTHCLLVVNQNYKTFEKIFWTKKKVEITFKIWEGILMCWETYDLTFIKLYQTNTLNLKVYKLPN